MPPHGVPGGRRRWPLVAGAAVTLVGVIAATAAITYSATKQDNTTPSAQTPTPAPSATPAGPQPQYSPADQAAAKQRLCQVFDISTRGQEGHGGLRVNGQPNIPVVLRDLDAVVGIQSALSPALPSDVAAAAKKFIDAKVDLTNAAMGTSPVEEVNRLTNFANAATDGLADACGLPH